MRAVVVTADQRGSSSGPDLVPGVLELLNNPTFQQTIRPFERTAGDEVQGLLEIGPGVAARVATLVRTNQWNIGIGIGEVDTPLQSTSRACRGTAFYNARYAVGRAKQNAHRAAITGDRPQLSVDAETVLWLWSGLLRRRSERGWEVSDMIQSGYTFSEMAAKLGISQSAVSQRAQAAGIVDCDRAERLFTTMLERAST